jgi:hypothetical protein
VGQFVCKLLQHMQPRKARHVTPMTRPEDADMALGAWVETEDLNAGYMLRSLHRLPKRGDKPEWQHSQDYLYERKVLPSVDLTDPLFSYAA